jgi:hypothetical protein
MSVIADYSHRQMQRRRSAAVTPQLSPRDARRLRIAGVAARSLFLLALVIVTAHVSAPQASTILAAHASFADLSLAAIGWSACVGVVIAMFRFRKDAESHRTWLVAGPALTALLLVCAIAWW